MVEALTRYVQISALWIRASRAYPVSWWMLVVGGFLITGIDFVGIWILFQNVDDLGGFTPARGGLPVRRQRGRLRAWRTCSWAGSSGSAR